MKALFTILFVSVTAFSANIRLNESIFGNWVDLKNATALDDAKKSFDAQCTVWKNDVGQVKAAKVVYSSCGSRKDSMINTYYYVNNPTQGTELEKGPVIGIISNSMAQLLLDVDGALFINESIEGTRFSCADAKDQAKCFDAANRALTDYQAKCKDFKDNAKKQMKDKLVFASCGVNTGANRPSNVNAGDFGFQFKSEGRVYYVK